MNNHDRRERDFIRVVVIALIALAILIGITAYSMYGPVQSYDAPIILDDSNVVVEPS
jgi:hypothetical protein